MFRFIIHKRGDTFQGTAFFISPETVLTTMLNESRFYEPNGECATLIADIKILLSIHTGHLADPELELVPTAEGYKHVRYTDGRLYTGKFNIVKAPRIPWGLENYYELMIYEDITMFHFYDTNELTGTLPTLKLLEVLENWKNALDELHNQPNRFMIIKDLI